MSKVLISLSLIFMATVAHANENKFVEKIGNYAENLGDRTNGSLYRGLVANGAKAIVSCSGSAATVAATAIADTLPVAGAFSEVIANLADDKYQTSAFENFLSWQTLTEAGRGTAGGATVATAESIEFMFLWLLGDEDQSFQATKKVYESTYVAFNQFFAKDSACAVSVAKLVLLYGELQDRYDAGKVEMDAPVKLNLN